MPEKFFASHRNILAHDPSAMLEAIRQAQARFIVEETPRESFGDLLEILLSITNSEYGFIGEVFHTDDGSPYLKTHSITNIAWDEETLAFYEKYTAAEGMEFHNLKTLFGETLTTGQAVIANDPENDPRAGGLPPGHPSMRSFMGVPFFFNGKMIGMVGVANNPSGYTPELVDWLNPFLSTCATLIVGYRSAMQRAKAEQSLQQANNNFLAVLQTVPDLMFEVDGDGVYLNIWGLRKDLLFAPKEELLGKSLLEVLPETAAKQVLDAVRDADRNGTSTGRQILLPLPQNPRWFELSVSRKHNPVDGPDTYIILSRDVTAGKIAAEEQRIAAATFESQEAILITDSSTKVLRANRAFEEITGYRADEVVGKDLVILDLEQHDPSNLDNIWSELHQHGKWVGEVWDRRKDGELYPKNMTITAVRGDDRKVTNYVSVFTDITQRKQSEQEIHQLAFYDPLTQLPNRRLLVERLQQAIEKSQRTGHFGALLFLDLDQFKVINDTKGHATGDLLLMQVARRLLSCSRNCDTVARLSGDEFVLVLEELSTDKQRAATQAERVAEKISKVLSEVYLLKDYRCYTTCSIGITLFCGQQDDVNLLFRNADVAMYQAKGAGRNAIRFFDPQMQVALEARSSLEADLRHALERQQLSVHYQIQVDTQQHPLGAEALLRWAHPVRGQVPPDQFIPLAEETGLIVAIGLWVLETACAQLAEWQRDEATRDITLAVNVSAKQFHQGNFADQVARVLNETGVDPHLLKLELTESTVLKNHQDTIEVMKQLKSLGVSFSLDDFGTGQSSLKYLKQLPLDQIKIDRSFVKDIVADPTHATIVNTIIAMGHAMDLDVIAEGVETEQQREFLELNGCGKFQGFLFSRPIPPKQFTEKLLGFSQPAID